MTKSEINKYKHILEAKQAELEAFVRNREGIAIEKSPDALDEVQSTPLERELRSEIWIMSRTCCAPCVAALRRIDEGTFGVCLHCEAGHHPVLSRRAVDSFLHPVPRDFADRNQADGSESLDELLVHAAYSVSARL